MLESRGEIDDAMRDLMYMPLDEAHNSVPELIGFFPKDKDLCDSVLSEAKNYCQYWGVQGNFVLVMGLLGRILFSVKPDMDWVSITFVPGDEYPDIGSEPTSADWHFCRVKFNVPKDYLASLSEHLKSNPQLRVHYQRIYDGKLECPNPRKSE
jgi:hypothetical protein